jgi:hypothetical protein
MGVDVSQIQRTLKAFWDFVNDLLELILSELGTIERWCHAMLKPFNLRSESETVILLFIFVIVGFSVARLFSGLVRIVLVVLAIGLTLDILIPALQR